MQNVAETSRSKLAGRRDQSGYLSADERRAAGKALREKASRAAHGEWKPAKNRRDAIEILKESNEGGRVQVAPEA